MTLSDGSKVWLNAGSSVTYPVAFNGEERRVQVIGEAYFEMPTVSTQPTVLSVGKIPFIVDISGRREVECAGNQGLV